MEHPIPDEITLTPMPVYCMVFQKMVCIEIDLTKFNLMETQDCLCPCGMEIYTIGVRKSIRRESDFEAEKKFQGTN